MCLRVLLGCKVLTKAGNLPEIANRLHLASSSSCLLNLVDLTSFILSFTKVVDCGYNKSWLTQSSALPRVAYNAGLLLPSPELVKHSLSVDRLCCIDGGLAYAGALSKRIKAQSFLEALSSNNLHGIRIGKEQVTVNGNNMDYRLIGRLHYLV